MSDYTNRNLPSSLRRPVYVFHSGAFEVLGAASFFDHITRSLKPTRLIQFSLLFRGAGFWSGEEARPHSEPWAGDLQVRASRLLSPLFKRVQTAFCSHIFSFQGQRRQSFSILDRLRPQTRSTMTLMNFRSKEGFMVVKICEIITKWTLRTGQEAEGQREAWCHQEVNQEADELKPPWG